MIRISGIGRTTATVTLLLGLSACTAALRFPLCPALAVLTYPESAPANVAVGRYVAEEAARRDVKVTVLSPFIAELEGRKGQIAWFDTHYRDLLCAFDRSRVIDDEHLFSACMSNEPQWIAILRSKPEGLMQTGNGYWPVCVQDKPAAPKT